MTKRLGNWILLTLIVIIMGSLTGALASFCLHSKIPITSLLVYALGGCLTYSVIEYWYKTRLNNRAQF